MNSQLPFYLALNRISGIGPKTFHRLLTLWPDLQELFKESQQALRHRGIPEELSNSIRTFDFKKIDSDLAFLNKDNQNILAFDDPRYPAILREIPGAPPILYAKGDLSAFSTKGMAIVGTRHPTQAGRDTAYHFAHELSQQDLTIVSGLAIGIDTAAHEGCLDAKGRTIGVLATGIDVIYPQRNKKLSENICSNGLIISEFPLQSPPMSGHFPRRNRIISGLSMATLVIEAALKSGSLITARYAMEQNRDVLAIPGAIHNLQVQGCHYLVQQGAMLVTSVQDVIDTIGLTFQNPIVSSFERDKASPKHPLLVHIGFEPTSVEQILTRTNMCYETLVQTLIELELSGDVIAVQSGYMRC